MTPAFNPQPLQTHGRALSPPATHPPVEAGFPSTYGLPGSLHDNGFPTVLQANPRSARHHPISYICRQLCLGEPPVHSSTAPRKQPDRPQTGAEGNRSNSQLLSTRGKVTGTRRGYFLGKLSGPAPPPDPNQNLYSLASCIISIPRPRWPSLERGL